MKDVGKKIGAKPIEWTKKAFKETFEEETG